MSATSSPLISIIVAVFNGAKTLQQCINSVVEQTCSNSELIIIDGGSKDGTLELLEKNSKNINYWVSEPDRGICNAWNKALAQTKGEWICFLGADDFLWNNQVVEKISEQLTILPSNIRVTYGQVMLLNHEGKNIYPVGEPWSNVKKLFLQRMSIPHPGLMHRRRLFEEHGNFDESFHIAGDYEFLLRELKMHDAFFISNIIVTGIRQGGISSSFENIFRSLQEMRQAQRFHGQRFPGRQWLLAMTRASIRIFLWNLLGEKSTRKALDLGRKIMGLPSYWNRT